MGRLLLFLLLVAAWMDRGATQGLPDGCFESNYTSSYTRCDLTFLFCFNYVHLKSCVLRKCDRFVRAGDCLTETAFQQEETDCYKNCCGSDHFDEQQCNSYNQTVQQQKATSTTNLTIVLSVIVGCLLIAMGLFLYRKLGCCDPRDPFHLIRFNVKWRKVVFEDAKCGLCHTYGSMLTTACGHTFHVSCFEEAAKDMTCPSCSQPLRDRIRIYCFLCREKAFKVKIVRITDIADAMAEARALHIDQCPRQPRALPVKT